MALALPALVLVAGSARADEQVAQTTSAAAPTAAKEAASGQLEEIVVTARYKKEDVQQTPIAITALTGDQMEERGFNSAMDVANSAPNVTIEPGNNQYGKSAQVFIRGIGQQDFNYAAAPGIGFYIDGVYFDSVFGSEFDLVDLDHIEVLRGPQGTLFGKNNEGGALRIFTVEPKGDDSGYLEVGYGSFNREYFKGAFDVPLIADKVFLRVSGASNTMDGYGTILDFACANPKEAGNLKPSTTAPGCVIGTEGGQDVQDARIKLKLLPVDGLEINLDAHLHDDRGQAGVDKTLMLSQGNLKTLPAGACGPGTKEATYYVFANLNPCLGWGVAAPGGLAAYNQNTVFPVYGFNLGPQFMTSSPFTNYGNFADPGIGLQEPNQSTDFDYGFVGTIDWDAIPGIVHVKSITGYELTNPLIF